MSGAAREIGAGPSDLDMLRGLLARLGDLLLPPRCLACSAALDRHHAFCAGCWAALDFIAEPYCAVTGEPFAFDPGSAQTISASAAAHPPVYKRARAALLYTDLAARLVSRLKYGDRLELIPAFARLMAQAGGALIKETDLICPVPLHARRLFWRRFNQSAELARALSKLTGVPCDPACLIRHRATRAQVGLSAAARRRNVAGAFSVPQRKAEHLAGRRILLIDDVMTTGATVEAAARALLKAGAGEVSVLTLARVAAREAPPI